ncbi:MAG: methyltransferase domain-containing protein [Zoogloeaceae bacterium]|nr:methyltransferase domain-containing protein [Zoogloeaceae bacterium]
MSMPGLADWLATPQGRYVVAWEEEQFDAIVADIFGYNALQVSLCELDLLRANRMPFRFRCGREAGVAVLAAGDALPFASSSLDLVLLPHGLEFSPHPHQVLREVERVLVPEGSVVVSGFNPYSLWGLRRRLAGAVGDFPWQGQYLSVGRIKDWFALLGFEAGAARFGVHRPPARLAQSLERCRFLEFIGARWWPVLGGAYVLHGIKRVSGMRLIQPQWRRGRATAKALAPVAQREGKVAQRRDGRAHG